MIKIELLCYFRGDSFSENDIIKRTGIKLNSVQEKDLKKVLPIRQFKKVVTIIPEDNNIYSDDYQKLIFKFSKFIKGVKLKTKQVNYENTVLLINTMFVDQCNFAFTNKTLKEISETFDDFYITCYEVDKF